MADARLTGRQLLILLVPIGIGILHRAPKKNGLAGVVVIFIELQHLLPQQTYTKFSFLRKNQSQHIHQSNIQTEPHQVRET